MEFKSSQNMLVIRNISTETDCVFENINDNYDDLHYCIVTSKLNSVVQILDKSW